jgi:integrase
MAKAFDFTDLGIKALTEPDKYKDSGTQGLYLQVTIGTGGGVNKSWIFKYKFQGKGREAGLGKYPAVSLAQARGRAKEGAALLVRGIDPLAEKAKAKAEAAVERKTFAQATEALLDHLCKAKADSKFPVRTVSQWRSTLRRFAYPKIGTLDVREVKHAHIANILAPLSLVREPNKAKGRGGPTVATALRSRIERVLDWAAVHGYRDPDAPNPARESLFRDLLGGAPPTQHFRAAPLHEVPLIYRKVAAALPNTTLNAIRFLILTATRLRETLDARWDEIDLEKAIWTIPASRAKTATEYVVPLSAAVLAVIEAQRAFRSSQTWVFPGRFGSPIGSSTVGPALGRIGVAGTTLHGFRSSFRDWAGEIGGVPDDVAEFALGHKFGNSVQQAYRRMTSIEARRAALSRYADWLQGIEPASNVVTFPAKAAAE